MEAVKWRATKLVPESANVLSRQIKEALIAITVLFTKWRKHEDLSVVLNFKSSHHHPS